MYQLTLVPMRRMIFDRPCRSRYRLEELLKLQKCGSMMMVVVTTLRIKRVSHVDKTVLLYGCDERHECYKKISGCLIFTTDVISARSVIFLGITPAHDI